MRRALLPLALTALIAAGCGEDEPTPRPSPQPDRERGAGRPVSGPGFTTRQPEGFSSRGSAPRGAVVLTMVGPLEGGGGFPPNVSVARTPAPRNASVEQLRSSIRAQSQAQGGENVKTLPDRQVDRKPAIGVSYRRSGRIAELTQRTYAVVHDGNLYTIASTTPDGAKVDGQKVLATVLDGWRWAK